MEWISTKIGLPNDGERVWFYSAKHKRVMSGTFWLESGNIHNAFVNEGGGHFHIDEISHYMEREIPEPPKTDL